MEFGEYLRNLIENRGYSYRKLAMLADIDHTYISKIVNGKMGPPSPDILQKMAKPLGISYEELMKAAGYLDKDKNKDFWTRENEPSPQELEELLKNSNVQFDGAPLDEADKEEILEFLRFAWHKLRSKKK
ncbi:helix-turn-helix domain-containing protein [Desulfitobacterium sp. Sab5]|uniref:helix-turn-helix domain-containing protein n=1 Tax=Desulfitobacterium nosdiversum TaxID=3375356 RepID=UPI003CE6F9BA